MKQTSNYQLPQWEESDRVMMKDFNGMTEKIDAALAGKGNCSIYLGSYTGTGTYGQDHPNVIRFPEGMRANVALILGDGYFTVATRGNSLAYGMHAEDTYNTYYTITWSDTQVSWYLANSRQSNKPIAQMNEAGSTYYYVLFQ